MQLPKISLDIKTSQALRVLNLLEEHHKTLARIIKVRTAQPHTSHAAVSEHDPSALDVTSAAASAASSSLAPGSKQGPDRTRSPTAVRRLGSRDVSSSIASNLATARGRPQPGQRRGVPASPEVSTQTAGGKVYSKKELGSSTRTPDGRPSHVPPFSASSIPEERHTAADPAADEGFNRFYSTFGSLFSKISPALAYASLPLSPGESEAKPTPKPRSPDRTRRTSRMSASTRAVSHDEPDLTELISKPALRALRDEAGFPITQESFYVVPPTGGTQSYAAMLQLREKHGESGPHIPSPIAELEDTSAEAHQRTRSSAEGDVFVDARETLGPPSPHATRDSTQLRSGARHRTLDRQNSSGAGSTGGGGGPRFGKPKNDEELELENNTLRQLLDVQSKRLQMWEAQSQNQTAMAQSFRHLRADSAQHKPSGPSGGGPGTTTASGSHSKGAADDPGDAELVERLAALEAQISAERARVGEMEKAEKKAKAENAKLQAVVGKYRERWEVLKQGARERQSKRAEASGTGAADGVGKKAEGGDGDGAGGG